MEKLKPLDWKPDASWYNDGYTAWTAFCGYRVGYRNPSGIKEYKWSDGFHEFDCESLEDAKSKVWQDYTNRVLALFEN